MTGPSSGKSESRRGNPAHLSIDFFSSQKAGRRSHQVKAPASKVLEVRKKKNNFLSMICLLCLLESLEAKVTYRQLRERPRERPFETAELRLRFHSDKDQSCRDQRISVVILLQMIGSSAMEKGTQFN